MRYRLKGFGKNPPLYFFVACIALLTLSASVVAVPFFNNQVEFRGRIRAFGVTVWDQNRTVEVKVVDLGDVIAGDRYDVFLTIQHNGSANRPETIRWATQEPHYIITRAYHNVSNVWTLWNQTGGIILARGEFRVVRFNIEIAMSAPQVSFGYNVSIYASKS